LLSAVSPKAKRYDIVNLETRSLRQHREPVIDGDRNPAVLGVSDHESGLSASLKDAVEFAQDVMEIAEVSAEHRRYSTVGMNTAYLSGRSGNHRWLDITGDPAIRSCLRV